MVIILFFTIVLCAQAHGRSTFSSYDFKSVPLIKVLEPPTTTRLFKPLDQIYADVPANTKVTLSCTAPQPVLWLFSEKYEREQEAVSNSSCIKSKCIATLTLPQATYQDTGSFICAYNDSKSEALSTSIYIFVNDLDNLIVPYEDMSDLLFWSASQFEPTTIPCLPSFSNASVILRSAETDKKIEYGEGRGITFNPTEGFHFTRPVWNNELSTLYCEVSANNVTSVRSIHVYWSVLPVHGLFPAIELVGSKYILVNETRDLECTVHVDAGTLVTMKWVAPKNVTNTKMHSAKVKRLIDATTQKNYHDSVLKNLTIERITHDNEGWYTCVVEDTNGKKYEAKKLITVFDNYPSLKLNISTDFDNTLPFTITPGSSASIVILVEAVPSISSVQFVWLKNGIVVSGTRFSKTVKESELILSIRDVVYDDGGNYSVRAISGDSEKVLDFQIEVLFSPMEYIMTATFVVFALFTVFLVIAVVRFIIRRDGRYNLQMKSGNFGLVAQKTFTKTGVSSFGPAANELGKFEINDEQKILFENLTLENVIGQGEYGIVSKGRARGLPGTNGEVDVAVKRFKPGCSPLHKQALFDELRVLTHIGPHPDIVNLLGAVQKPSLMVVVEYCPIGCLRNFLISSRTTFEYTDYDRVPYHPVESLSSDLPPYEEAPNEVLKTLTLFKYAFQVARGMEFVASKKVIHRDLAARNILLSTYGQIKICDFGLTKNCYYYGDLSYVRKSDKAMPIKWMAIEAITDALFTEKTDVWSFGVLMWEMFMLGSDPYPGFTLDRNFYNRILKGMRLDKPEFASAAAFKIMTSCWLENPSDRPTFHELRFELNRLVEELRAKDIFIQNMRRQNHSHPSYVNVSVPKGYISHELSEHPL